VTTPSTTTESTKEKWFWKAIFPNRSSIGIFILVVLVAPSILGAIQMRENPKFSPIDETAHFAYAHEILSHGIPRLGQHFDQSTMKVIACQGVYLPGWNFPSCEASAYSNAEFPGGGFITEAIQPPGYYLVVGVLGQGIKFTLGINVVHAYRFASLIWLIAGLATLWAAGRIAGIRASLLGSGILVLAASPIPLYYSTIVSNDASSIFAGSLIAFLGLLALRRPGRWVPPVLAVAGFSVVILKPTDIMAAIVIAGLFASTFARQVRGKEISRNEALWEFSKLWLRTGGILVGFSVAGVVAWSFVQKHIEIQTIQSLCHVVNGGGQYRFSMLFTDPLSLWYPLTQSFVSLNPVQHPYSLAATLGTILATMLAFGLAAGGLSIVFAKEKIWANWMGLYSLIALYVVGVVLAFNDWGACRSSFGNEGRYGLSCAALLMLAFLGASRGKWIAKFLWMFGILLSVVELLIMTTG
jgi:hypothetical protein